MGRIFISAGHYLRNSGAPTLSGTTEAQEMMKTRDLIVNELTSQGVEFFAVPDTLDLGPTIRWINERSIAGDIALEIHGNSFRGTAQGAEAYYIDGNIARKKDAEMLLEALTEQLPTLKNRGAKPDTASQHPRLAFCRDIDVPSVLLELCFLDNRHDLSLLQNNRNAFAKGIAKGLIKWSNQTAAEPATELPIISIKINDLLVEDKGVYYNNNSFIPVNLVERLNLTLPEEARTISQGGIVYVKAIDLDAINISAIFDETTKTILLKTNFRDALGEIDKIMSSGKTNQQQLTNFLKLNNEQALADFSELPALYIEEAKNEGVNHDIAFCQMCLETGFLSFGGVVQPEQNNFSGLGALNSNTAGATFPNQKTGIKAHIQHLKAYASQEAITQPPIVDPRFHLIARGIAPLVGNLSRRWATDAEYGNKIIALLKRLYRSARLI